jgi:hypothetical protein
MWGDERDEFFDIYIIGFHDSVPLKCGGRTAEDCHTCGWAPSPKKKPQARSACGFLGW